MHKFKVWWPEIGQSGEDARMFDGWIPEDAAAAWAEWYDANSAEYLIVGGEEAVVQVLQEGETVAVAVRVTGESVPLYHDHLVHDALAAKGE